ncbi:MAG: hypothetical protein JSV33_03795 [bacterium]|nr:MAG: hypothetical protein JSV33_03795 [bacterium]
MEGNRSRVTRVILIVGILALAGGFSLLIGGVPQTITVDGSNDFLPANLVDVDGGDTQFSQLDIDTVYVTNDANKLYIGFYYNKGGWTDVQLCVAIAVGDTAGGTTDAWGHAIAWNTAPTKPDYQAWCNMDNSWQELRKWNSGTSSWDTPISGTSSLGWINNTGFEEMGLNFSDLGISMGDTVCIEWIVTQTGATKGPLDAVMNDGDQLSRPSGTTWDVGTPVELDSMYCYVVQVTGDTDPPVVLNVDDPPGSLVEAGIDDFILIFNEPVDETTAENAGNYTMLNTTAGIDSVVRDPGSPDRVHIYLNTTVYPGDSIRAVEVVNVEDLASNVIVDNDSTNMGDFYVKGVLFRALMSLHFTQHSFPTDTVTVEGDLDGLTWIPCDNAFMTHVGGDVYEQNLVMIIGSDDGQGNPNNPDSSTFSVDFEWKLNHQCAEYEPRPNRQSTISIYGGPRDTLEVWWNDEDDEDYTDHPIDVIFTCDFNIMSPGPDSVAAINGSVSPLTFDVPSMNNMADDGVYPDGTGSDGIYAIKVRFPAISFKTVNYKYLYNDVYECIGIGDREVWLNDAAFDTVGGTLGPLVMPVQYYDRCITIGRAVEVVFRVRTLGIPDIDTVAVNGTPNNQLPEVINWNIPSINPMTPSTSYPGHTPGEEVQWSISITFPDSSDKYVEYKYLHNSNYECEGQGNRYFYIDDTYDAVGNPQILEIDYFGSCDPTDVPEEVPVIPLVLNQNYPNPFNPVTTITFTVPARERAVLRVYNVKDELVRTILDRVVDSGEVSVTWEGDDSRGRRLVSGVYFYELRVGTKRMSRKMVLLR